jgi:hypothetical protein
MKRPSKDSDEANRFPQAADELSASSHRPAAGETVIQFPSPAASAGAREDAGVSSASASSFVSIGAVTHAVVLRLRGGFPKIRGPARPGGAEPRRSLDQREGEDR